MKLLYERKTIELALFSYFGSNICMGCFLKCCLDIGYSNQPRSQKCYILCPALPLNSNLPLLHIIQPGRHLAPRQELSYFPQSS